MSNTQAQVQPEKAEEAVAVQSVPSLPTEVPKPVVESDNSTKAPLAEETAPPAAPATEATSTTEAKDVPVVAAPAAASSVTPAQAKEAIPESTEPAAPAVVAEKETAPATPLEKLLIELPTILESADHNEMWGVTLTDADHVPTTIVLEKFIRANTGDVVKAKAQLIEALKWRKKTEPQKLLEASYDGEKFGGLGYVATYDTEAGKEIVTFNIYGAVKNKKATFGNIEEFIKWRVALMEISVRELNLASKTAPIPTGGIDPYRTIQVHDYLSVSFLRQDPAVKAATNKTISTLSMAYPELMKEKFFVNVPVLMGWMFAAMKLFLSPETVKKFHLLSYGSRLATELPLIGDKLPETYGGKGPKLENSAATVKYAEKQVSTVETTITGAAAPAYTPVAAAPEPVTAPANPAAPGAPAASAAVAA